MLALNKMVLHHETTMRFAREPMGKKIEKMIAGDP